MKRVPGILIVISLLIGFSSPAGAAAAKLQSLCQLHYPSDYLYEWECVRITSKDYPSKIFKQYWKDGLRFNRMDRRHFTAGRYVKVPKRLDELKDFTPMPEFYLEAEQEPRFILIDQNEMFLGAYEYGKLVFSMPVAVGMDGFRPKNGFYRIDAADARHESSLYLVEGMERPYPMHYALRFFTDKKEDGWTSYWLHGRDLPGYPASHGCIGLYDEEMQKEYYREPEHPTLMDAKRLYHWVVKDAVGGGDFRYVPEGPKVLIMGDPPAVVVDPPKVTEPVGAPSPVANHRHPVKPAVAP